jgi:Putative peptidoglycan-binding domain-containing protein
MTDEAPLWLLRMRSMNGLSEKPGAPDETKILAMADNIARAYPEMESYCNGYSHDSIPWCGLAAADCMATVGVRPPFGSTDTDRFLWARSWADDPNYGVLKVPRLGCVVVLTRSGGGHVTFYESTSGTNYMCRGGNQSDAINLAPFPKSNVVALVWPKSEPIPLPIDPPSTSLPVLRKGSTGPDVVRLQELLPKWIDGDFGTTTESLVKEFQRSEGLEVDGVVGEQTWAALLDEEPPPNTVPVFGTEGPCSWFGGPNDTGVAPDEGLAFITDISQAPHLFLPYQPSGTTGLARRLDPEVFYIACRWDYKRTPRAMLLSRKAIVRAIGTGIEHSAYPADWGPNAGTGRVADLSPGLMEALGIETDDEVEVEFPT